MSSPRRIYSAISSGFPCIEAIPHAQTRSNLNVLCLGKAAIVSEVFA